MPDGALEAADRHGRARRPLITEQLRQALAWQQSGESDKAVAAYRKAHGLSSACGFLDLVNHYNRTHAAA